VLFASRWGSACASSWCHRDVDLPDLRRLLADLRRVLILPIGGADMPTVIALLNSYAGLSACAMGFALDTSCW